MSITRNQAIRLLHGQGLKSVNFTFESNETLCPESLAQLLLSAVAPDNDSVPEFVNSRSAMKNDVGETFLRALALLFSHEPARLAVTSISICQDFPAAWIRYTDDVEEYSEEFEGRGFRREIVISGGTIAALAMKLHFDAEHGWKA